MTPVTARCDGSTIGAKAGIRGCSAAAGPVKIRSAALTKGCTLSCTCVSTRKLLRSARGRVRGLASPARQRISACAHKALQSAASHQAHMCVKRQSQPCSSAWHILPVRHARDRYLEKDFSNLEFFPFAQACNAD